MSIVNAIRNSFEKARHREWDEVYWHFDIHGTMIKPNYSKGNIPTEFYDDAERVLKMISNRPDIKMILFTCSWPDEQSQYFELFESLHIKFHAVNSNPFVETKDGGYGYYVEKPYMDVLFEDKAGFDPETDWLLVEKELLNQPLLKSKR